MQESDVAVCVLASCSREGPSPCVLSLFYFYCKPENRLLCEESKVQAQVSSTLSCVSAMQEVFWEHQLSWTWRPYGEANLGVASPTWGGGIPISKLAHSQTLWVFWFLLHVIPGVALSRGRGMVPSILATAHNLPNWAVYYFISPIHRIVVFQTLCLWT